MSKDIEFNLMRSLARRLEKTEQELAALPEDMRARVKAYLRERYGWLGREKVERPEVIQ